MKRNHLPSISVVGLLLAFAGFQLRAIAKEPTVDERFRGAGNTASETELPLLTPPQSKLVRDNPTADVISGPAYFGVTFTDNDRNAVVRSVAPGSPAEQAGLKPGDVVETLQGIAIDTPQNVLDIIAKMRPGTMLDVGVSRRVNLHAQAPLGVLPGGTVRSANYPPDSLSSSYSAPVNVARELIPVPMNGQGNAPRATYQPNRNNSSQRQSAPNSNQRRTSNQSRNQSDDNRGLLGRRR